jgi:hypothetical protein
VTKLEVANDSQAKLAVVEGAARVKGAQDDFENEVDLKASSVTTECEMESTLRRVTAEPDGTQDDLENGVNLDASFVTVEREMESTLRRVTVEPDGTQDDFENGRELRHGGA